MPSSSQLRAAVRPNYILHYIMEGKGKFFDGKESCSLHAGQGFLIEPEVQTYYEADPDEPWTYLWSGFAGEKAGEYLRDWDSAEKDLFISAHAGMS